MGYLGSKIWTKPRASGNPPSARFGHSAASIDSTMYIFGGTDGREHYNDLNEFVLKGNKWSTLSPSNPPIGRAFHTTTTVNGKVYVFGGSTGSQTLNDLHCYDPCLYKFI